MIQDENALSNKFDHSASSVIDKSLLKMKNCTKSRILKIIFCLLLLSLAIVFGYLSITYFTRPTYSVYESMFRQKLDHFDESNNETFQQQYFYHNSYWGGPGYPVFLKLGGEGDTTYGDIYSAWCQQYAKEFEALCITLEHR